MIAGLKSIWPTSLGNLILPAERQVKIWRRAARRMHWNIGDEAFKTIPSAPELTKSDILDGFIGVILSYGFEADDNTGADSVYSGKVAWQYACRT